MGTITKEELFSLKIEKPSKEYYDRVKANWDSISKPLDSMGKFETLFAKIGSIQATDKPAFDPATLVIMCADNGVVEEGISQSGQDVTAIVSEKMGLGLSSVCVMGSYAGIAIDPVDIGINTDKTFPGVKQKKVARGTKNFYKEPAMTEAELLQAIAVGMEECRTLKEGGAKMLALGEMGIGNTTTTSAVVASLLDLSAETVTGRGSGLTNEGLSRKIKVINESIKKYELSEFADKKNQAFESLRCVGGLDIAGLCGVCIGAGLYHIPVVLDGVITMAAALAAERMVPGTIDYLIPSHLGKEPVAAAVCKALKLNPIIYGDLALGEGTGAVMLFPLLKQANQLYSEGTHFEQMGVEQYVRL